MLYPNNIETEGVFGYSVWITKCSVHDGDKSSQVTTIDSVVFHIRLYLVHSIQKVEVEEVDLCPVNDPKDAEEWDKEIKKAGIGVPTFCPTAAFWRAGMLEEEHL